MAEKDIPVYLFTGFMDSGKTTLIQETLFQSELTDEYNSILVIACEDGDVEYDIEKLKTVRAKVATVDNEEDFTLEKLEEFNKTYKPDAVFLEYNGTWDIEALYDMEFPSAWVVVQALCTIDATTFELYLNNMRTMMTNQFFKAEVVIVNRCDDNTPKSKIRGQVKAVNRPAQIVYERADGTVDDRPEELPFDINADVINISDADYALWFMDCMEDAKKYDGKTVHFLALVYNKPGMFKDNFVPGRFAMTCCADDIQFLGMKAKYADSKKVAHKSWIDITAKVKYEKCMEYKGYGPVLYPTEIKPAEEPADGLVYFS